MIGALARPPVARVFRTPRALLALGGWCVLGLGFAVAARSGGSANGADHVLVSAYGALVLPLLAYTLVGAVLGPRSLAASTAPLARFGAAPARAAAVTVGVALLGGVVLAAGLGAVVAVVAHGAGDPPVARDALESAYAGALGGAAYVAWFAMGASFGKRGGGRTGLLVVDWVLGLAGGALAVVTPRAHLRNLLGGTAPMDWSGRASALALVVIAAACVAVAVRRAGRE
ncbi:MAG TPA: hypothetical protein VGL81_28130 [Polyangiaceae bacterium]